MAARRYRAAAKHFLRAVDVDDRRRQRDGVCSPPPMLTFAVTTHADLDQLMPRVEVCAPGAERSRILGAAAAVRGDTDLAERHLRDAIAARDATPLLAARCLVNLGTLFVAYSRGEEAVAVRSNGRWRPAARLERNRAGRGPAGDRHLADRGCRRRSGDVRSLLPSCRSRPTVGPGPGLVGSVRCSSSTPCGTPTQLRRVALYLDAADDAATGHLLGAMPFLPPACSSSVVGTRPLSTPHGGGVGHRRG